MTIADSGTGLGHVSIHLKQKDQDVVLSDETFDKASAPKTKTYDVGKLMVEKYKIQDGPATLTVVATDHALRNFLKGNQAQATKDFQFSVTPPQLEVISGQHYINQGGSECVVYRVSSNVESSGVQVGKHFFPGYPAPGSQNGDRKLYFALFALEYDEPVDTDMKVVARETPQGTKCPRGSGTKCSRRNSEAGIFPWKILSSKRLFRKSPAIRRTSRMKAIPSRCS